LRGFWHSQNAFKLCLLITIHFFQFLGTARVNVFETPGSIIY
jgi:hypothetical protein